MIEQIVKILEQAGGIISLFALAVIILSFVLTAGNYALGLLSQSVCSPLNFLYCLLQNTDRQHVKLLPAMFGMQ